MKKRILSLLCVLCLLLTMLPTSAFAAGYDAPTLSIDASYLAETNQVKMSVKIGAYTDLGALDFHVKYDKEKLKVNGTPTKGGLLTANSTVSDNNSWNPATIGVVWADENGSTTTTTTEILTVIFDVIEGKAGAVDFSFDEAKYNFCDKTGEIDTDAPGAGSVTSANVTIPKAPISSVTIADLDAPVKGAAPDTSVTVTPSSLAADVKWFDGETQVTGNFAASTKYTVKIKLTASGGDNFAETVTASGYDVTRNSETELLLTKTFDATAIKDTPTINTVPTASAITFGQKLSNSTLTGGEAKVGSAVISGTFKWKTGTIAPQVKDSNATEYEVVFKPNDTTSYETTTCKVKLTVNKKSLSSISIIPIDPQPYTGLEIKPDVTVKDGQPPYNPLAKSDYSVAYSNNKDVGTANYTIKETPTGNYKFNTGYGTFTIKAADSSISITGDPSKTYDGTAVTDPAVSQSGSTGAVTYTYYTNEDCTTETTNANSGAASDGAAPKNAGDYWVTATVAASGNYGSATSVAKKFTISQKALTDSMINLGTQNTYNGAEQSVAISSVKDGGTSLISTIDYTITGGNKATDVGNNTLVIEGKGNYKGTARATWSLVAKDVTITPDAKNKTYGAADPELTYTTSIDGDTPLKNKFNEAKSGELSYTGTNVGAYIIGIGTLKAGNNFNLKLDTTTAFFTINQATPVITATTPRQLVNNGVEVDISDWASFTNTDSGAKLTYTLGSAPAGITLAGNKLKAASSVAAGVTFEIKVNAYGTHNFTAPTEFTIHVTVVNKKDAGVSITTPPTSKTYGDANFTVTATKTAPDGGTWKWTSTDDTVLKIVSGGDSATATVQVLKASAAGATLTVTYTSSTYYGSASATITVAQKEVTISGITAANKEYDGSTTATPTGTAVINGKVGSDDVTVTAGTATFADKNVGTGKTVTFTGYSLSGADAGNYNLKAQPASVTANITAKVVKLTGGINATDRGYVKDNKTVDLTKGTLTFDGLVSGETLDVNIPTTGTISNAKVGTYNVTYSGVTLKDGTTDKASNYKLVSPLPTVTVNITKAPAPALSDIPVSQKYNVTTGEKAIGAVMPADAGTLTYTKGTESKTGSVTVTSWAVDVTGKVTYTLSGGKVNDTVTLSMVIKSTNYADATVNVVITIIKATPTGEPAYTKITTSGKTLADAALTTTGSTLNPNAGTLVWVDNAGNVLPDTTTVEANKLYKWVFTPSDSTNYESINGTIKLWSKSSGGSGRYYPAGITFTTDLPVGTINRVAVNGKTLDSKNYVVNGSDVTLLQSYLDTLKAGKYTVKIENKTHVSTGTFTIKADGTLSSPRTADAGVCLYAAMALMSGTGAAYVTLRRKKEN